MNLATHLNIMRLRIFKYNSCKQTLGVCYAHPFVVHSLRFIGNLCKFFRAINFLCKFGVFFVVAIFRGWKKPFEKMANQIIGIGRIKMTQQTVHQLQMNYYNLIKACHFLKILGVEQAIFSFFSLIIGTLLVLKIRRLIFVHLFFDLFS